MATRYPSDRPGNTQQPMRRPAGARPSGTRPASARPAANRHPAGASSQAGGTRRPPQGRAPQRRRKKPQGRFYAIIAAAVLILVVLIVLIAQGLGSKPDPEAVQTGVSTVATATVDPSATAGADASASVSPEASTSAEDHGAALAELLGSEDAEVQALSEDQMAKVEDLAVNQGLPEEWMNILLLGSDERTLSESARTDSMIICSINRNTGEVKLTSIMRDLAVDFDEIGQYNDTYRINAANYFGGEELAMKIVNECFGMNIESYVHVNFYGFQQVAEMLGGIEMDITEEEMNLINELIVQQAMLAYYQGIDESALKNEFLETYGPNTHLDGRQTLAYARIRKLDGGDFMRAERQRNVLIALMNKLRGKGAAELLAIGMESMQFFRTNLTLDEIISVATIVCNSDIAEVESFRLPVNNSYVQETRNEQSMLYDCDWATNARELYNFIYE